MEKNGTISMIFFRRRLNFSPILFTLSAHIRSTGFSISIQAYGVCVCVAQFASIAI